MQMLLAHLQEYWLVHLLLTVYTVLLAHHAWTGNRQTRGLADYYVGGRAMGGVAVGLSYFATYSSTNSFVGFSGQAYSWGPRWLLLVPFIVLLTLAAWVFVAPRLREFTGSVNSLTIPDYIGLRFESQAARVSAAGILLFASFFYMTAVFTGIGNLLERFLGIPYEAAIAAVFVIVLVYTVAGGFIAVVKTDMVQGLVMIAAAILLFRGTSAAAGGLGSILPGADEAFPQSPPFSFSGPVLPVLLGVLFATTVKALVEPRQLSRFYALKDRKAAFRGLWISLLCFALVYSLLTPIGLLARRILPPGVGDTDLVVPELIADPDIFSPGVAAFLLVAMVAAAMSSLDSVLLVMASTAQRDVIETIRGPVGEAAALRWTRILVAVFAAVTMLLALRPPGDIVTLTSWSGSLYAACFFPAVVLGLYCRRGNGVAVLSSFGAGLGVLLLWGRLELSQLVHPVFPALVLSIVAYLAVSFQGRAVASPAVMDFFRKNGV